MACRIVRLATAADWDTLEKLFKSGQSNPHIPATLIRHLQVLNAISFLIEDEYVDRDFSDAYSYYYAKTFRRHSKLCTRLLFFASDVSFLNQPDFEDIAKAAQELERQPFIGQIILRPVSRAPVNLATLGVPPAPTGFEGYLLVRAHYSAHILGAELSVEGVPMTQQDSRVGACAQATIWVASRHFHMKHRGPWLSTVAITQAATVTSEHAINVHVPAGSEFLTGNNMVAALRAAGREPFIYVKTPSGWDTIRPHEVINRYIDSGIPVIVGLQFSNRNVGHAVLATGHVLRNSPRSNPLPSSPTVAEYCEAFYVNDDQVGPNVRFPVSPTSTIGETSYNVEDNVYYVMIPLPSKVYLPAETAEVLAWDSINNYAKDWPAFKTRHSDKLGASEQLGDSLNVLLGSNEILARTFLTYGWRFKHRAIRNKIPHPVRQVIRTLQLPRFVYVTEFSSAASFSGKTKYERRVLAHCVVDPTAKHQDMDSVLMMYAPGFCLWREHDSNGVLKEKVGAVENSTEFYPKIRGESDFSNYELS